MKPDKEQLERMLYREVPSQLIAHVTKKSYNAMLMHADMTGTGADSVWACKKSGARIKALMVRRNIYSEKSTLWLECVPVLHLYCGGCDKKPQITPGEAIFDTALQSVSI